jgi:hypothetical protein
MLPRALRVGRHLVSAQADLVKGMVSWRLVTVRRQHNTPLKLTAHVGVFDFSPVCRSLAAPR